MKVLAYVAVVASSLSFGYLSGHMVATDEPPVALRTAPVVTVALTPDGYAYCPDNSNDLRVRHCVKQR